MKTSAKKVIFFSVDVDGAFATAIINGLQPNPSSPLEISLVFISLFLKRNYCLYPVRSANNLLSFGYVFYRRESFDLPLDRYGITDTKASGNVTHFLDTSGVNQVSILVLQKYESPILACAVSEVLLSLAGEDASNMPSLILPFLVDSTKLKLERKRSLDENIYGIQIGLQTDMIKALASRHVKAPSSMQIHHEPMSCALQLVRVLSTSSFILIGQSGLHKTSADAFEIICEIGESLASATSMQFVKEKVTWNPMKVLKEQEKEPWRALYG
ncbi:hypothetical protein SSX86_005758 [Deinandra increscens subsp. villosa]|uniref:DUF7894 domain-containing protein n=1 Tax=Deinandra increscens subsp. villosa TaxID=3103831 RepID=A0AAP0DMG5_9ASTR